MGGFLKWNVTGKNSYLHIDQWGNNSKIAKSWRRTHAETFTHPIEGMSRWRLRWRQAEATHGSDRQTCSILTDTQQNQCRQTQPAGGELAPKNCSPGGICLRRYSKPTNQYVYLVPPLPFSREQHLLSETLRDLLRDTTMRRRQTQPERFTLQAWEDQRNTRYKPVILAKGMRDLRMEPGIVR
jgi:hypothetical protein